MLKIRWDITNNVMDIFQGWYKDGTEGTRDYRFISGFYFLLRISLACEIMIMLSTDLIYHGGYSMWCWELLTPGIAHFMLGAFFFTVKPYKRVYMNHMDGLIFTLFGGLFFIVIYSIRSLYIVGAVIGTTITVSVLFYSTYKCIKQR